MDEEYEIENLSKPLRLKYLSRDQKTENLFPSLALVFFLVFAILIMT